MLSGEDKAVLRHAIFVILEFMVGVFMLHLMVGKRGQMILGVGGYGLDTLDTRSTLARELGLCKIGIFFLDIAFAALRALCASCCRV